jgi:sodium transport system permease protein
MKALAIARKEWREMVRDRRSLYSGMFYGIWGPMVMGMALVAMARHQGELGSITIGAHGVAQSPALVAYLASRSVSITDVADAAAAIRNRQVPAAIVVDPRYAERFTESRPAEVDLLFNSSRPESNRYAAHVRSILADYARATGETRLVVRGIAPAAIVPVRVIERDFATVSERAGRAFATLPIFLLLAAFVGGMSVAADVAAGERERGSLESLLLHPVSRGSIVTGKWIAVSAAALATVALALAVSYAVLRHPRLQQLDLPIGLNAVDALAMLALLAPLALAAAGIQLLMAVHARTYKEAQTKLSMLIFLPMIPGFLIAFGTLEPANWMRVAPMIGHHMLMTDLVRGDSPGLVTVASLSIATLAIAGLACAAASRQLDRESVLRRAGV